MKKILLLTLACFYSIPSQAQVVYRNETINIPKSYVSYCFQDHLMVTKRIGQKVPKEDLDVLQRQDPTILADIKKGVASTLKRKGMKESCGDEDVQVVVSYIASNQTYYVPPNTINIPTYTPGTTVQSPYVNVTTPGTVGNIPINVGGYYQNSLNVIVLTYLFDPKKKLTLVQGRGEKYLNKVTSSKLASVGGMSVKYLGRK